MPDVSAAPHDCPLPRPASRPGPLGAAVVVAALTAALAVSLIAGTALGGATIAFGDALRFLWAALTGGDISFEEVTGYQIVWRIRAPRVLLAALVGAALSACGAVTQALVRNVLADPFILGVSAGASVGAVSVTIVLGGFSTLGLAALAATSNTVLVAAGAFLGAIATSALVWFTAHRGSAGVSPVRLVLTGVVIASGLQALMAVIIYLVPDTESTATVLFWTMGSFGAAAWGLLPPVAAMTLLSLLLFARHAATLDVLAQGDEAAAGLGVDPNRARRALFAVVSLAAAAATCPRRSAACAASAAFPRWPRG